MVRAGRGASPSGRLRFDDIGLETQMRLKFDFDIDPADPLSAIASLVRSDTIARGAWRVRIDSSMRMTASAEGWHLEASMAAFESEEEVSRRNWKPVVARKLV